MKTDTDQRIAAYVSTHKALWLHLRHVAAAVRRPDAKPGDGRAFAVAAFYADRH